MSLEYIVKIKRDLMSCLKMFRLTTDGGLTGAYYPEIYRSECKLVCGPLYKEDDHHDYKSKFPVTAQDLYRNSYEVGFHGFEYCQEYKKFVKSVCGKFIVCDVTIFDIHTIGLSQKKLSTVVGKSMRINSVYWVPNAVLMMERNSREAISITRSRAIEILDTNSNMILDLQD